MGNPTTAADIRVRHFDKVCEIINRHQRQAARLIPILQEIQAEYRYLPEEVLAYVATSLQVPPAHVYGVATFYAHFALAPKGKYVVRLCDGTACHVRGSNPLLDAIRARLKLSAEQPTTPDLLFTVETVSCLGACGLAPVMVVNDQVYGQMTPAKVVAVIDEIAAQEAAE
jgi:NADH-quinone oxidoreductase subunit E